MTGIEKRTLHKRILRLHPAMLPLLLVASLSACSTSSGVGLGDDSDLALTDDVAPVKPEETHKEVVSSLEDLERTYREDTKDRASALKFANALRRAGKREQAVAVLRRASTVHTGDPGVQAAYGKALAAQGDYKTALRVLQTAQRPDLPDWRLISAEGAVLDQIGQHDAAREKYQYALSLAPNEPAILSNIGMSHVLTGDLSTAEQALAKAGEHPRADSQVRQNLALVYGLQGRFDKAERIAKIDLSPDQVEQNMAYLRTLSAKRQAVSSEIDQRETTASVDRNSG